MPRRPQSRSYSTPKRKGDGKLLPGSSARSTTAKRSSTPKRPNAKRPPEITAARWAKLGEPQRRRYESFYREHPGQPLYRARGKGAAEHLTRADRRLQRMEAIAARQEHKNPKGRSADEIVESLQAMVAAKGDGALGKLERHLAKMHADRVGNRNKPLGLSPAQMMEFDGIDWSDYDGDEGDLFYG